MNLDMDTNSFSYRVKILIAAGIKVGGNFALWYSIIYFILIMLLLFILSISVENDIDSAVSGLFIVFVGMMVMGILPATVLGVIGGGLIGLILSFWRKHPTNIGASLIGLAVGSTLILIWNYLFWFAYPSDNDVMFWEYFFSLRRNLLYLIPSLIAFIVSPYVGWKINKKIEFSDSEINKQISLEES